MSTKIEDAEIETAAVVIKDLLDHVPKSKRAAVLARATEVETEDSAKRDEDGYPKFVPVSKVADRGHSPYERYWHDVMRLKAQLICAFTRSITNNHSAEQAAELLFNRQGHAGSGYLEDYLDRVWELKDQVGGENGRG